GAHGRMMMHGRHARAPAARDGRDAPRSAWRPACGIRRARQGVPTMARSRLLRPRRLLPLLVLALPALPLPAQGGEVDRPARLLRAPAQALPGRGTGEAVMGAREAFVRAEPQLRIGRRRRGETEIAEALPAQLAGDGQTLRYECDLGERVELAGNDNLVEIRGQCLGLSITGNGNQVTIEAVDDI